MRETWYVLEDGAYADPNEVAPDGMNVLRHKSGIAVAMRGQVPSTRGVNPEEERANVAIRRAKESEPTRKKGGYATRESKPR